MPEEDIEVIRKNDVGKASNGRDTNRSDSGNHTVPTSNSDENLRTNIVNILKKSYN